jgi:hypothetical protein
VTIGLGILFIVVGQSLSALDIRVEGLGTDKFTIWPVIALHIWATVGIGRRFYTCSRAGAWWRAAVLFVALAVALMLYRFLLFVFTIWQLA